MNQLTRPKHPNAVETAVSTNTLYHGAIIKVRKDEVQTVDGSVHGREVVEHPGGAAVLATLDTGRILLIRQFRYALGQYLYEFPAGKLDAGENPADSIRRELLEETGYEAKIWEEITYMYTTPGFCNEKIYLYRADGLVLSDQERSQEDENIELLEAAPEEIARMIRNREIIDAKTICLFGLVCPQYLQ